MKYDKCLKCGTPKKEGDLECPKCGVVYEKAEKKQEEEINKNKEEKRYMSLFKSTPEEHARREQRKEEKRKKAAEAEKARQEKEFNDSPAGKARAAKKAGMKIFQIDMPLSKSKAFTLPMLGAYSNKSKAKDYSNLIQAIEEEGWHLEHVSYVFRWTGSESRDKFLASGQQESVSGEIIGIYIFRAMETD